MGEVVHLRPPPRKHFGLFFGWPLRQEFIKLKAAGADFSGHDTDAVQLIEQLAPALPRDVASSLARYCLGEDEDELLLQHEFWHWPALAEVLPPTTDDPLARHAWSDEPRMAMHRAASLRRELDVDFDTWFLNAPASDLRRWRDALLPKRKPALRRSIFIRWALRDRFGLGVEAALRAEYGQWRAAIQAGIDAQMALSTEPPLARHLQHLANLVLLRLTALRGMRDVKERNERERCRLEVLTAAATGQAATFDSIFEELRADSFLNSPFGPQHQGRPHLVERSYALAMEAVSQALELVQDRDALHRYLELERHDELVVQRPCAACAGERRSITSERDLPPYGLLCTCLDVTWHSATAYRVLGPGHDLGASPRVRWWALCRVLGVATRPAIPSAALRALAATEDLLLQRKSWAGAASRQR